MKRTMRLQCASAALAASLCGGAAHAAMDSGGVIENYADIAHAMYEDSLNAARDLDARIGALLEAPGAENLSAARTACSTPVCPTCTPRCTDSAMRSSTTGKAR